MTEPVRVQLSRGKGWRMPPNTVKVDRSTPYGNPFTIAFSGDWFEETGEAARIRSVFLFEDWLDGIIGDDWTDKPKPDLTPLRGKNLACWCALDKKCHADVLLRYANAPVCEVAA